jgi:hypothetical protein
MRFEKNPYASGTLYLLFAASLVTLGNTISRTDHLLLVLAYLTAFFTYLFLVRVEKDRHKLLMTIGVIARMGLMLSLPKLSDDFYRFLWDGELLLNGYNPYLFLPKEAMELGISSLDTTFYNSLNSPGYYTIYPPLNQYLFAIAAWVGESFLFGTNVLRGFIILADLGSLRLLYILLPEDKKNMSFWYFLNPLVILELTGNIHFEGLVVFFVLLTIWIIRRKQWLMSGLAMGFAIGTKLLPLILLPYLLWKYRWKPAILLLSGVLILLVVSSYLVISDPSGIKESFSLYFQSFEFNASIYYLLREIGFWQKGYNIIGTLGPGLALASTLLILLVAFWSSYRKWSVSVSFLLSFTIYFFLSTTIHPWYIVPLIAYGILAGFYYPVIWSFLIFFTYLGYTESGYEHHMGLVVMEYVILFAIVIYEFWTKKHSLGVYPDHADSYE